MLLPLLLILRLHSDISACLILLLFLTARLLAFGCDAFSSFNYLLCFL